jgi:hypothetical protein
MSGHAVMDDSNDETKMGTCELESEHPVVTTKEAARAFRIITQWAYCDKHGSCKKLDVNLFSVEKACKGGYIKIHEANEHN